MSDKPATEYRVEKAGGLTVYHPIRPSLHATQRETAVMCA